MKWNTNGRIAEAALLALSIVVLGLCIRWGIDDFANKDRKVTVKGLAEKEVDADKVTWPILSKELGNSLPDLYDRIERTQDKIKRFLTDNGIKENEIDVTFSHSSIVRASAIPAQLPSSHGISSNCVILSLPFTGVRYFALPTKFSPAMQSPFSFTAS